MMATLKNDEVQYGGESRSLDFAGDRGSNSRSQSEGTKSAERIGTAVAMIVLSFALVLLVIWAESRPNFARCSAMGRLGYPHRLLRRTSAAGLSAAGERRKRTDDRGSRKLGV